ncbi:MAG TPA: NAD(P)-dependent oxidoreductase [Rhodanobacteraceae bacterium]|nr:NAD(P)-dependent oxidoreductase [Rhodanobacteraceae bacterium]
MKIALIGISGRVGSRIFAELLSRGHTVTGIARDTVNVAPLPGLEIKSADAADAAQLAPLLVGHDAVISASKFVSSDATALIAAVRQAGVPRLLVVGGAGSLEVAPGKTLADTPGFPESYKAEAAAGRAFLETLRSERDIDWAFVSPSAEFAPGLRTGKFRLGGDQLLADAHGKSWISMEDFAIALVDELETPRHPRQRFTVGY